MAEEAVSDGVLGMHDRSYNLAALWSVFVLTGTPLPQQPRNHALALEAKALDLGVIFNLTHASARVVLERQARIATRRLIEYRTVAGGVPPAPALARASSYAVRWSSEQAVSDMGANSSATDTNGNRVELLKTWVRLASRFERRSWHDALNGMTIPYSQAFQIVGPNGVYLVHRPYDPSLPLSETIRCGHGIRVEPPRSSSVTAWSGGQITPNNQPERNAGNAPLPAVRQTSRTPFGTPISQALSVPEDRRHEPVRHALELVDRTHGDGNLEPLIVSSRQLNKRTLGGYALSNGQPAGILFNSRNKITPVTALEEIAHMLDHQMLGGGLPWGSKREDSDIRDVIEAIKNSKTFKRVSAFTLGQRVALRRNGGTLFRTVLDADDLEYQQSVTEWFGRAYTQFIAVTTGDPQLLNEIASLRSTPDCELLYPSAWPDDEFEAIAAALERTFVAKGWMR
jgi:hypothetical protein